MEVEVKAVMAKVFDVEVGAIEGSFGPGAVDGWDSAGHMRLIMALEERFDVMFEDDDVENLVSVKAITEAIGLLKS